MPVLRHRGIEQYYRLEGAGPELVWCHGLFLNSDSDRMFWGLPQYLAHKYRLLTFDARGHGKSSHTGEPGEFSWAGLADDLAGLIAHVGFSRPILAGGSMGGITSLYLAAKNPGSVRGVILYQPSAVGRDVPRIHRLGRVIDRLLAAHGMEAVVDMLLDSNPALSSDTASDDKISALRQAMAGNRLEPIRAATRAVTALPGLDDAWLKRLQDFPTPVLLVVEPGDPVHPQTSAEQLHKALAQATLTVAPQSYHYFLHPGEMADLIDSFVSSLS